MIRPLEESDTGLDYHLLARIHLVFAQKISALQEESAASDLEVRVAVAASNGDLPVAENDPASDPRIHVTLGPRGLFVRD